MADTNPQPETAPEIPAIDEGLKDEVSKVILDGLEARGLLDGRSPEEISKIVGQTAAGGAINALKQKGAVSPPEGSQPIAESSMGDLLSEYTRHNGSTDPEKRVIYSSKVDEAALEKAEQAKDAFHDDLTPLLNRRGFDRALDQKMKKIQKQAESSEEIPQGEIEPKPIAFFVVDLNGLTEVNNEKGHSVGDKVIKGAAKVLAKTTRKGDIVARTGGDEFWVVICEDHNKTVLLGRRSADSEENASELNDGSSIVKSFSSRAAMNTAEYIGKAENDLKIDLDDLELAIGGVEWDDSKTFEEMYKEADAHMYRDKTQKYAEKGKVPLKAKKS